MNANVVAYAQVTSSEARASWRDYFNLTKPTITLLVVVTVLPGILLAANGALPKMTLVMCCLVGTWLASSSAAVFNHLVDVDVDRTMVRTKRRPVASGRVQSRRAMMFGVLLAVSSFFILSLGASVLSAVIALAANAFYVLFYTMYLKRRTVQNIVIGGAAGAVGPLIGWAAVEPTVGWPAFVLFLIIFLWTPPHFWALAIKYKDDYAAAGIPMMPVVKGDLVTRKQIFIYTLALIPVVASLYLMGAAGVLYLTVSLACTLYFAWMAWKLLVSENNALAMPLFHYSCLYLFGVFGSLIVDRLLILA